MTPTAVVSAPAISEPLPCPAGASLVIGSLGTAQNGTYQALVTHLTANSGSIEKQMLDRLIGGGNPMFSQPTPPY